MLLAAGKTGPSDAMQSTRRSCGTLLQRTTAYYTEKRTKWPRMSIRAARLFAIGGISRKDAFKMYNNGLIESTEEGPL
jgi:hypothetical protein